MEDGCTKLQLNIEDWYRELKAFGETLVTANEETIRSSRKFLEEVRRANAEFVFNLPKSASDYSASHLLLDNMAAPILNGTGVPNWTIANNLRPNQRTVYSIPSADHSRRSISYFNLHSVDYLLTKTHFQFATSVSCVIERRCHRSCGSWNAL